MGAALVMQEGVRLTVINTNFIENRASYASVLWTFDLFEAFVQMINCTFEKNFALTTMIEMLDSSIILENSSIISNLNPTISIFKGSVNMTNLFISESVCNSKQMGCFLSLETSSAILQSIPVAPGLP